jgi:hypothetical protein
VSVSHPEVRAVLRSWLTAAVLSGASLLLGGQPAHAQQVCDSASLAGGEACFYSGPHFTGTEFDLSIPLDQQLPVLTDGNCTDLPTGIGLAGSVTNASGDTLYVLPVSCPDSHAGVAPSAIVVPHYSGDIHALTNTTGTHSVRMCAPGLMLDPLTLHCAFPH